MPSPDDAREAVARAIYMTHWTLPPDTERGIEKLPPPTWEIASAEVREWVRAQADSAIDACVAFLSAGGRKP